MTTLRVSRSVNADRVLTAAGMAQASARSIDAFVSPASPPLPPLDFEFPLES